MDSNQSSTNSELSCGQVFVISGPTAVGKGTVVKALKATYAQLFVSISATTRKPRPNEIADKDYYFIDDAGFDQLIESDGLLEWARVHDRHRYGTPREPVEKALTAGKTCILEIDLQGARQVRTTMPAAVQIFLTPPSSAALLERLHRRGTETDEQIQMRLATARTEMAAMQEFDFIVPNIDLAATVAKLVELLRL